jgi:alkylation response protein AidB-like acyl-CoA dehydrogenase
VTAQAATEQRDVGEGVVERTTALVPLLREHALETDRNRRVAPECIAALEDAGVFRITLPRRFGGYEVPLVTQVDVLAEVARGCGSSSWVAAVYSMGTWVVALFSDEAQDEVFATVDARITLVATPSSYALPVAGGYKVTGRWGFNSGCLDAHWAVLGTVREGSEVPEGHLLVVVPYAELEIHDDWFVSGLRGTGSCSVSAADVFVPDHRVLPMPEATAGIYRSERNAGVPLYRAPLAPVIVANSAGTPLGLGQAAMEAFRERLPGRAITFTDYTEQREAPVTHLQVAEAAMKLDSAAYHARRSAELIDAKALAGEPYTIEERARVRMDLGWVVELARSATVILQSASGATSIHEDVPIQRIGRDIEALSLHAILNPTTNLELYGRVLLGLEPNTVLL